MGAAELAAARLAPREALALAEDALAAADAVDARVARGEEPLWVVEEMWGKI